MEPSALEADRIVEEAIDRIVEVDSRKHGGVIPMDEVLDLLLDVRAMARRGLESTARVGDGARRRTLRIGFAMLELHIDDFLRSQPAASAEDDQAAMDRIGALLGEMRADPGVPPDTAPPETPVH